MGESDLSYTPTPKGDPYNADWTSVLTGGLGRALDYVENKAYLDLQARPLSQETPIKVRGDQASATAGKPSQVMVGSIPATWLIGGAAVAVVLVLLLKR